MRSAASIFRLLLAAITVALLACACRDSKIDRDLCAIEELTDLHADSAKKLLESGEFDHLTDSFQLAHRALSEVAIQYKLEPKSHYVNDSLIRVCRKYFENSKDLNHRMRFHYYAGLCEFATDNCGEALTHFLIVLECAEKLDLPYWQGLGNRAISNVYLWNCNYPEIVRYAKRALKYFQKNDSLTNNSTREYTDFMRWQLTFALSGLRKCDEAIALCNEGLRVAQIYNDSALRYDCTSEKATALYRKGNFREAARLYGQLCSIKGTNDAHFVSWGMANYYAGNIEKAKRIFDSIPKDRHIYNYPELNYLIASSYGNKDDIIKAHIQFKEYSDSMYRGRINRAYTIPTVELLEKNLSLSKQQITLQRYKLIITFIIIAIFVVSIIIIIIHIHKKNKQQKRQYEMIAHDFRILIGKEQQLTDEIESSQQAYNAEIQRLKSIITQYEDSAKSANPDRPAENSGGISDKDYVQILKTKYELFETISKSISTSDSDIEAGKTISRILSGIRYKLRSDENYKRDLEKFINTYADNLMAKFRKEVPGLKDMDYDFYMLCVMRLNTNLIADIMEMDKTAIYNQRRKIRTSIDKLESEYLREFFKSFITTRK